MGLTHRDVDKILEIVDGAAHLDEIEFVHNGLHLRIELGRTSVIPQSHSAPPTAPRSNLLSVASALPPVGPMQQRRHEQETAIRAPVLGTFHRSSTAAGTSFVEPGQRIHVNDTVGVIKTAARLTAIKAGVDGVVKHIFPNDGELVEFDQLLFFISTAV